MAWIKFDGDRIGWIDGGEVADVSATGFGAWLAELHGCPMLALIRCWPERAADAMAAVAQAPRRSLGAVVIEAPLSTPSKIIGAPANYAEHAKEMQSTVTIEQLGVFLKAPSSIVGPGGNVVLPVADRRTDQEGELAVVIGRRCRNVTSEEALSYVFAYSCILDISHRGTEDRSTRKSYDTFTPFGPSLVMPEELGEQRHFRLRCWVNEELRQDESTEALIFDVSRLIEYASSIMTLEPGDVIATGTPAGVGPIVPGDRVILDIESIGRLEVGVVATP